MNRFCTMVVWSYDLYISESLIIPFVGMSSDDRALSSALTGHYMPP